MKLVALIGILSVSTLVHGQDFVLNAGLRVGGGVSSLVVDDEGADYSFGPSYHFGGFIDYSKTKVGYELDVMYSVQKTKIDAAGEKRGATLKYISVPVVVKYYVSPGFSVQAGPQVSFLTCFHSDYHPVTQEPFQEQDYTTAYGKTDFGLNIGTGYHSQRGLVVDLRYYHGLKDIAEYAGVLETRNRSVLISIGYRLYSK